ncbi:endo-beta-1,4-glucanase D [Colletotrichum spaethianum]|uniref:lytic cellulose monooxygenase (C4-dehydrogenating) n=1 Tax=Colletotrichum spaethianum TaxID=700344 RepID=A0AA37LAP0_9PEZI|nr:endo-beta-1,4-glucanase D [Colletotrichum spaethianum]GKT45161.1 endo-beta-1,4-glucanase D [Colletotrichum spaethianum]
MKTSATLAVLSAAGEALGHATFQQLWIGSQDQKSVCARLPPSNSPVTDVTSNDLRCNVGGATGVSGVCKIPGKLLLHLFTFKPSIDASVQLAKLADT